MSCTYICVDIVRDSAFHEEIVVQSDIQYSPKLENQKNENTYLFKTNNARELYFVSFSYIAIFSLIQNCTLFVYRNVITQTCSRLPQ